jgi:hypothetical protein
MEKYRDNVRAAVEALRKRIRREKHSSGYKQLEIHVGKGIREIRDDFMVPERTAPMQLVERGSRDLDVERRTCCLRRPANKAAKHQAERTGNRGEVAA